ncbi:MAG: hypothetical protein ACK5MD_09640, partial [Flavobacteriales bacterium]
FEVTYPDTIQFNAKAPIQLFIGNDHQVDGQTFDITYRTKMEGEMYYEDKKVSMHNMPKGWDEVSYKPLEAGTYNIEFTASNGDEQYDISKVIKFTVDPLELNFDAYIPRNKEKLNIGKEEEKA